MSSFDTTENSGIFVTSAGELKPPARTNNAALWAVADFGSTIFLAARFAVASNEAVRTDLRDIVHYLVALQPRVVNVFQNLTSGKF
jgi:hypothetical protein